MTQTEQAGAEAKPDTYECMTCGAPAEFSPEHQALRCGHCGAVMPIEGDGSFSPTEHDFSAALAGHAAQPFASLAKAGHEVECESCGAHFVIEGQAGRCAYCDSPAVVDVAETGEVMPPESVLPFAVPRGEARQAFTKWVGSRWFAPSNLRRRAQANAIDGVYIPYFTYDSKTTTRYVGQRGEHYWVTEHYTDSDGKRKSRRVRRTRWYPAAGRVHVSFDDVLVCASRALPRALIRKLEPWDLEGLTAFDGAYLSGFLAERYSVELEEGFGIAEERMQPEIRSAVCRDIGGDEQRVSSMQVHHDGVAFKHFLLPLWISSYRYGEKVYRFFVNARTGEISGDRPYSWVKITLTVLLVLALVGGGLWLGHR